MRSMDLKGTRVLLDLGPDLPSEGTVTGEDWETDTYTIATDKGVLFAGHRSLVPVRHDVSTVEKVEAFLADEDSQRTLEFRSHVAVLVQRCSCMKPDGQRAPCGCSVRRTANVTSPRPKIIVAHDTNVTACSCKSRGCACVEGCDVT